MTARARRTPTAHSHTPPTAGARRPHVIIATRIFRPEGAAAALRLGALADALAEAGADVTVLTSRLPRAARRCAVNAGPTGPAVSSRVEDVERREGPLDEQASRTVPFDGAESGEGPHGHARRGRVRVRRAPVLRDRTGAVRGYLPYLSFDVPLFFRLLVAPRADVVVDEPPPTTGAVVRAVCRLRRMRQVHYAGDIVSDAAEAQGALTPVVAVVRGLERAVLRDSEATIGVTGGVCDRVRELAGRDAHLVPNGVDVPERLGRRARPADFPAGAPVLLYAGTVAEWLRPDVFLDALPIVRAEHPGAVLVVLGQGSAWESLRERARGVEGVVFHPPVTAEEARAWCAHADVALSSLGAGAYEYAYPTKMLAALAEGTPVVHAGAGDAARDVERWDLGACAGLDGASVARAVCEVLERRGRGEFDGERLRQWVEDHRSVRVSSRAAARVVLDVAEGAAH